MKKYYVTINIQSRKLPDARFDAVEQELRDKGYQHELVANNGEEVELPAGTFVKEVEANSHSLMQMRVELQSKIAAVMAKHEARGCFYIAISTDWDWAYGER